MNRIRSAVRRYLRNMDKLLPLLCLLAAGFGLALIYSATRSYETGRYLAVQTLALALGLGGYVVLSLPSLDLNGWRWYLLLGLNVLLLLSLAKWGVAGNTGNRSWLRFGGIGIQPSELVKLCFVPLLACQLQRLQETEKGLSSLGSVLRLGVHFLLLFGLIVVISGDLGSALVLPVIFAAMCFAAGLNLLWFLAALGALAALTPLIWTRLLSEYQRDRILAPYFPELVDPTGLDITWQTRHSKMALASGGLTGQGYLQGSTSQSDLLPFKHTDFIFSVAGEELGLVGCLAILLLLTAIILRVLVIGMRARSTRDMLLCVGFAAQFCFQAFENTGMCVGLTPVVGITLPFISYGGSSLVTCFAAMGLVAGVRIRSRRGDRVRRLA